MDKEIPGTRALDGMLAGMLHYGTWLASAVIALGLVLALAENYGGPQLYGRITVTVGIALFILLPITRVILMLVVFLRERDYWFVAIATLVLLIIIVGFALGMMMPSRAGSH